MRRLMPIAALLLFAGCSRAVTPAASGFAEATEGRIAGPPQTCVSNDRASGLHALDAETIAYGSGRTVYINRLPGSCPGLTPLSTLFVEVQEGRYCRGDRVRGREMGAIIAGPPCILGDWVPYRRP